MAAKPVQTICRLFRLWGVYARIDAGWFLRDTKICLITIATDIISSLSVISGVLLLSQRFGGVGGMSSREILFMLGYATLVEGVFQLFFMMCNVGHISRRIGRGQLDHMMIQPVPLWMQLVTEGFIPVSGSSLLVCGTVLTAYAVVQLHLSITPLWLLWLCVSVAVSVAVVLGVTYIASAAAFYAPAAAEEVSTTAFDLFSTTKSYPLGGMGQTAKVALCTVLPVGLAAWFPANALLGKPPAGLPSLLPILAALFFLTIAAVLFRKGLRHYAKTGCNRYHDRGHRR
jgi:ABC-2 type transport system permease protein